MQYTLQIFEYENDDQFRTMEINGEPWFVLVDACRMLDIKNASDAAGRLDDDEKMTIALNEGQSGVRGGARSMTLINESGLYSLILRSDKPEAKRFKKWITSEVLPTIRKTGGYHVRTTLPAFIKRYNQNWDRVAPGHFSILSELVVRLWGRLEQVGHVMADRAPDGTELRPDTAVGRRFADWLRDKYPDTPHEFSYYMHWTPQGEFEARQYANTIWPIFVTYVDTVWIKDHSEEYFRERDPAALPYLPKLLPNTNRPQPLTPRRFKASTPLKLPRKLRTT